MSKMDSNIIPMTVYSLCRFDMLVNGGGSVTVRFIRGTAPPTQTTVILSWNSLVTLDPVILLQVNTI